MSDNSLLLEWNSHKQNLSSNMRKLLRAQEFVDVTLVSEGHSIRCHRLVLSASSSFFDSILQGTEGNYPVVVLPAEIKLWHVQGIIDYMYLGELTIAKTGLNDFLSSAKMLKIRGLCDINDRFVDGKEEYVLKKNDVKEEIKPNEPDIKNLGNTTENPHQVVSTTTNDGPASINKKDLGNNKNQAIKEARIQGPPPAYQERGPILNNIAGCIQPSTPPKTSISRDITRPVLMNRRFEYQMNKQPQEASVPQIPTSISGNSSNFENRSLIKPPVSHTLTAELPLMDDNSTSLSDYFESTMNRRRRLISDQSITPQAFEMLKRINSSPTPSEKRLRLSHPSQLASEPPRDFHPFHQFPSVSPKTVPIKRNTTTKNSRASAKTTPPEQQFQHFNMPSHYGPPSMLLSQPRSSLPGISPQTNISPHMLPHPSLYLHPNLRAFANSYANNFKM